MNRRTVLQSSACGLTLLLSGCDSTRTENETDEGRTRLEFIPENLREAASGWELALRVKNPYVWAPLHDVTLVAFDDQGTEVCRKKVGDLKRGGLSDDLTVTCTEFPAVITGTAAETPCDGAQIEILYWVGTDEQRGADVSSDVLLWEKTYRRCDEPLPPERVLDQVGGTETADAA